MLDIQLWKFFITGNATGNRSGFLKCGINMSFENAIATYLYFEFYKKSIFRCIWLHHIFINCKQVLNKTVNKRIKSVICKSSFTNQMRNILSMHDVECDDLKRHHSRFSQSLTLFYFSLTLMFISVLVTME